MSPENFPPSPQAADELAKELKSPFFTPEEAAEYLRIGEDGRTGARTLAAWRTVPGKGPLFRHHGRAVVYHQRALDKWSAEQERGSTLEQDA